jgi:hypothetical protein
VSGVSSRRAIRLCERCFGVKAQDNLSRGRQEVPDEAGWRDHGRRASKYRRLIRFSHLNFRESDDLCLRNLDCLSNYLALLIRRKECDIRGVASEASRLHALRKTESAVPAMDNFPAVRILGLIDVRIDLDGSPLGYLRS